LENGLHDLACIILLNFAERIIPVPYSRMNLRSETRSSASRYKYRFSNRSHNWV
jgi:hypothetical protein